MSHLIFLYDLILKILTFFDFMIKYLKRGGFMELAILSDLIITRVFSVNNVFTAKGSGGRRETRPNWAIVLKHEGETVYSSCGKRFVSNAENAAILPMGSSYTWECLKAGYYYTIEFEAKMSSDRVISVKPSDSDKVMRLFSEAEKSRNKPFGALKSICCAYELLVELLKSAESDYSLSSKQAIIKPSVDYLTENFNKTITNEKLGSLSGISTVYFRKIFTESFGMPPITYQHKLRISRAKELLHSDYGSISEIAEAVGYKDIYHFSKMFKNYIGLSPRAYIQKKNNREQ